LPRFPGIMGPAAKAKMLVGLLSIELILVLIFGIEPKTARLEEIT
jgi:hypothetical protein